MGTTTARSGGRHPETVLRSDVRSLRLLLARLDQDQADLERARQLLYVGLSRARSLLVVVGDGGEIWDAGGPEVWERISTGS